MARIKINRNSLHAFPYRLMETVEYPKSICGYFWKTIALWVLVLIFIAVGIFLFIIGIPATFLTLGVAVIWQTGVAILYGKGLKSYSTAVKSLYWLMDRDFWPDFFFRNLKWVGALSVLGLLGFFSLPWVGWNLLSEGWYNLLMRQWVIWMVCTVLLTMFVFRNLFRIPRALQFKQGHEPQGASFTQVTKSYLGAVKNKVCPLIDYTSE